MPRDCAEFEKELTLLYKRLLTSISSDKSKNYKLNNAENKSIAVSDIESGTVSISFEKGLEVSLLAVSKSR